MRALAKYALTALAAAFSAACSGLVDISEPAVVQELEFTASREGLGEYHQGNPFPCCKNPHTRSQIIQIVIHSLLQLDRSGEEEIILAITTLIQETNAEHPFPM